MLVDDRDKNHAVCNINKLHMKYMKYSKTVPYPVFDLLKALHKIVSINLDISSILIVIQCMF